MKGFLEHAPLVLIAGIATTLAAAAASLLVFGFAAALLGQLAAIPFVADLIAGERAWLSLAVATVAALAIVFAARRFPRQARRFGRRLVAVLAITLACSVVIPLLGIPGWLALNAVSDGVSVWAIIPCGIATAWLLCYAISHATRRGRSAPAQHSA